MNTSGRLKTPEPILGPAPRIAARGPQTGQQTGQPADALTVALTAAVLAVRGGEPVVAVVPPERAGPEALPCGPFQPRAHRTLEIAAAAWAHVQTGVELGFLQQLATLADCPEAEPVPPTLSVSYLALVTPRQCSDRTQARWRSWYAFFPWEDWRDGRPACLGEICARLEAWAAQEDEPPCAADRGADRRCRIRMAFGGVGTAWDEEKVLDRYALLKEAGLLDTGTSGDSPGARLPRLAHPLAGDQVAALAMAIGELRRAVKCRPVVFELMPDAFTLFELQRTVEAVLGPNLHKQNFRRMIEGGGLVEPTGEQRLRTGGRPARLYRFRRDVLWERTAPGVRVKSGRA
jgi:hypothetical protein